MALNGPQTSESDLCPRRIQVHLDYDRADSLPQGMQHLKSSRKYGGPWSVCTLFDIGEFADTTREATKEVKMRSSDVSTPIPECVSEPR
jgi:hypothetical protein